jgi:hypothetical protein
MVAAWMSALTGVGPSMASGSHVWSGSCADLATAPPRRPSAIRLIAQWLLEIAGTFWKTSGRSIVPVCWISRKSASAIVASPNAFMMNAFLAASTAVRRWCQKPIRRYDDRPTRPQPASTISRFPPSTSRSIEKTKSAM